MIASRNRTVGNKRISGPPASAAAAAVEPLEPRRLLAGNVTAALDPATGVFEIRGDNKANQVRLEFGPDDQLRLIGFGGTTVNGAAAPLLVPHDADRHVVLGNGDDTFEAVFNSFGSAAVFGTGLSLETGNGDDTVLFDRLSFRPTVVSTGNGNDEITMIDTIGTTELRLDTGNGSDAIRFVAQDPQDPLGGNRAANATLLGGNGRDTITGIANLKIDTGGTLIIDDVETTT